jgi:hypothetical protein
VYIPLPEILPPLAFQETAVLVVPLTLAVNCCPVPICRDAALGSTAMDTETGDPA